MSVSSSRSSASVPMVADPVAQPLPRPATWLARVRKYALVGGGLCAAAGAIEGAVVGALLAPRNNPGALIMTVALDRALLLGLGGAVFGAGIGLIDWLLGSRRKRR